MSNFTILSVNGMKEWTGDHGTFHIYDVDFDGEQGRGAGQIKQKDTSPAPTVGQVIDAEIVQKPGRPPELKRVWKQSSNGGGASGRSYGKSPEERAQIARMNAHGHALKYWEMKYAADTSFRIASWEDYLKVVELFYADVKAAA